MSIRVLFMGPVATVTRERECVLPLADGATLRDVLDTLGVRYGADFMSRVFRNQTPPRALQSYTRIFVDGRLVDDAALELPVAAHAGQVAAPEVLIYLMPAASGG